MAVAKITLQSVKAMQPGETLVDIEISGFEARRQKDAVVYSVRAKVGGRKVRFPIGRHGTWTPESARKEAQRLLREVGVGNDPRKKRGGGTTLADVASDFLAYIEAHCAPLTHREYRGHLNAHLIPRFGAYTLEAIPVGELRAFHTKMADRPYLANRIMATLSSVYGWQQEAEPNTRLYNPAKQVKRFPEKGREWRGSAEQIAKLAKVLHAFELKRDWSPFALGAIWLYLATGQRRNSIRNMLWTNVDWENSAVKMHVKRRGLVTVPFNGEAMAILRKLRELAPDDGNPYVIRGSKPNRPYQNMQNVWDKVRCAAGIPTVRIHDLRHHVGSLIGDEYQVADVAKVLGNTKTAAMRYIHSGDLAEQAADLVGKNVRGLRAR
jgi:integrase